MKALILYWHPAPPHGDYTILGGNRGAVRVETVDNANIGDLSDALDYAEPRQGEVVLNTVEAPK